MNQGLVRPNESPRRPALIPSERQGKTWHSLTEIYGARWIRDNGDAPGRVWNSMINALTDNEISTALANLVKNPRKDGRGNIHPPSAPEFWEAAKVGTPRSRTAIEDHSRDNSKYGRGANQVLMLLVSSVGGIGKDHMKLLLKEKARLVADFDMMAADGEEIDWREFITVINTNLERVLKAAKEA